MESMAEFGAEIGMRYQFTVPLEIRKLLALKGKKVEVGDRVIVAIIDVEEKGEGLDTNNVGEDCAKEPSKDNGGNSG